METILLEINGNVAKVTFNRPNALNALNKQMLVELDTIITNIGNDPKIKYIIFIGVGKAFIAGADIAEMSDMSHEEAVAYGRLGAGIFRKIELLDKITIALVNGYCLGGGAELAMACDMRICSLNAKFGQPEVTLGITPGFSGTVRLPRLIGIAKAKELLYTGKVIDANDALVMGLVTSVVSTNGLAEAGENIISSLEKNSFNALIHIKKMLSEGMDAPIDDAIELENIYFAKCFNHNDQKEGMKAFLEKRKANFE